MPKKAKKYDLQCDLCPRVMNDTATLTAMYKTGVSAPITICSSGKVLDRGTRTRLLVSA